MSQLIQMQRRIRAIETTKKITQAMRLISISLHTRLKNFGDKFINYEREVNNISKIGTKFDFIDENSNKNLYIIIGSNKGLCGSYNQEILRFYKKININENDQTIIIGKQLYKLENKNNLLKIDSINSQNIENTTAKIVDKIYQNSSFKNIFIINSKSKSFFYQIPQINCINEKSKDIDNTFKSYWWWPEEKEKIVRSISNLVLKSKIDLELINSLISEQAARFRSMDSATSNAKKILDEMKLKYNKARQAKITKEITELSNNFQSQN